MCVCVCVCVCVGQVTQARGGKAVIVGGLEDLVVLKTTQARSA